MAYGGMEEDLILVSTQLVNTLLLVLLSIKHKQPIEAPTVMVYNCLVLHSSSQRPWQSVALSCMKLTRHGDYVDTGEGTRAAAVIR